MQKQRARKQKIYSINNDLFDYRKSFLDASDKLPESFLYFQLEAGNDSMPTGIWTPAVAFSFAF